MTTHEQPHLVSLVLQSKKALKSGEQCCSQAKVLSNASAQVAVDVLALDAKVRWMTDAIGEQLKLAASVAKSIEEKRSRLSRQVQEWDGLRVKQSNALDSILESLGSQHVPPDFHQTSADSSLFGSQHSDDEDDFERKPNGHITPQRSPSATVRIPGTEKAKRDRSKWKTLRDFVDEHAIEDILETMENERTYLDDTTSKTDDYPETLTNTITSIRASLPELAPLPDIESAMMSQDHLLTTMARNLESLAGHYDQMADALRESEAGEPFEDEDLQAMNRDTQELPSIMLELEEKLASVEATHDMLKSTRVDYQGDLDHLTTTLDDLDELGEIMTEMLQTQDSVENDCEERLSTLQQHLFTLEHLHDRFLSYQTAFSKLILEIARRRVYREAAESIIRGMTAQLEAMTEEERQVREHFNAEHGAHLPEDICLCIGNPPTRWEVVPWNGEALEVLPDIEKELIAEAKDRTGNAEGAAGAESL